MEKSKLNSFVKRAVTAIIFAPLIVYVLYLGAPFVNLFFFMCGAAMAWEWANMVPNKKPVLYAVIYAYAAAVFSIFGILYLPLSAAFAPMASKKAQASKKIFFICLVK